MDSLEKILEKLENLENRISKIEGEEKVVKNHRLKNNTISPKDMPVGKMAYVGRYESEDGSMGSTFGADCNDIATTFNHSSFEMAKVIDAFSSEDRINIVKELIKRCLTAKQLMEKLNFATTGKLYHHLSFLEKIGVIVKDSDSYHVSAKYISCVVLIFTGVASIINKN